MTLDILRTINATCTAAGVDLTDYLVFVFTHAQGLHDKPETLTPIEFAKHRDSKVDKTSPANASMGTTMH